MVLLAKLCPWGFSGGMNKARFMVSPTDLSTFPSSASLCSASIGSGIGWGRATVGWDVGSLVTGAVECSNRCRLMQLARFRSASLPSRHPLLPLMIGPPLLPLSCQRAGQELPPQDV